MCSDKCVHFFIQQGIKLSRSNILFFEHNDMNDLERVLDSVAEQDALKPEKLNRRFIIAEGLYQVQLLLRMVMHFCAIFFWCFLQAFLLVWGDASEYSRPVYVTYAFVYDTLHSKLCGCCPCRTTETSATSRN